MDVFEDVLSLTSQISNWLTFKVNPIMLKKKNLSSSVQVKIDVVVAESHPQGTLPARVRSRDTARDLRRAWFSKRKLKPSQLNGRGRHAFPSAADLHLPAAPAWASWGSWSGWTACPGRWSAAPERPTWGRAAGPIAARRGARRRSRAALRRHTTEAIRGGALSSHLHNDPRLSEGTAT